MSNERVAIALDFGTGTSTNHHDGVRWIDYRNITWNPVFCKRCDICVDICPKGTLVLRDDAILELENCILCGLCERYCPDLAIEMIPASLAAYAAKGGQKGGGQDAPSAEIED
jgi:2-oxoglutarate ferredoxin oxidoreductase subunit delta